MRTGFLTKKGSLKWMGFLTRTGFLTGKDSLRWKGFLMRTGFLTGKGFRMRMARQMK